MKSNRIFNVALMSLIIANVMAVILETVASIEQQFHAAFFIFDMFSVAIFSAEYILRIWTCEFDDRYGRGLKGKFKYMVSPMAVVDLLAVLPSLLPIFFGVDLRILREFRLFRLIRLFKLARYSQAIQALLNVFKARAPELIITFAFGLMTIIFSASVMYFVEHEAQPDKFSSIPQTMWWAVSTLTTVGYGDVYPITSLGKFLGAIIAVVGVGLFALPAGIVASGFAQGLDLNPQISNREPVGKNADHSQGSANGDHHNLDPSNCPHCGKDIKLTPKRKFVA